VSRPTWDSDAFDSLAAPGRMVARATRVERVRRFLPVGAIAVVALVAIAYAVGLHAAGDQCRSAACVTKVNSAVRALWVAQTVAALATVGVFVAARRETRARALWTVFAGQLAFDVVIIFIVQGATKLSVL
jgi:hypothetical protein